MKTLVLITSQFPFGTGESFISAEFPFLEKNFDRVIIIAQNTIGEKSRNTPETTTVFRYKTSTSFSGFLYLPVLFIINSGTIISMLREEIEFRLGLNGNFTVRMFLQLFKRIFKALQLRNFISEKLKEEGISNSIVFYSYWLKTGAQAIAMLSYKDSIKISRAHGSDIYEEKTKSGYLPLLRFTALNLDAIFFISNQGKKYLEEKIKTTPLNFIVSLLGTEKPELTNTKVIKTDKFTIVSCSNMVALKRIDLIIKSLAKVKTNRDVLWLHFGDGVLRNSLENLANEQLEPVNRISYKFMGYYPNDDLLEFYGKNKVDLFINTSSTEGIPVSIMEAQSFGIPVIATDTGGVKEIVTGQTGSLLSSDFHPDELAERILYYMQLTEKDLNVLGEMIHNNWRLNFNAASNYSDFIKKLNSILASSIERNTEL